MSPQLAWGGTAVGNPLPWRSRCRDPHSGRSLQLIGVKPVVTVVIVSNCDELAGFFDCTGGSRDSGGFSGVRESGTHRRDAETLRKRRSGRLCTSAVAPLPKKTPKSFNPEPTATAPSFNPEPTATAAGLPWPTRPEIPQIPRSAKQKTPIRPCPVGASQIVSFELTTGYRAGDRGYRFQQLAGESLKSRNHQPSLHSKVTFRHPSGTCG